MPMALLSYVLARDTNSNPPRMLIPEGKLDREFGQKWTYLTQDGWQLTFYWITFLIMEPELVF